MDDDDVTRAHLTDDDGVTHVYEVDENGVEEKYRMGTVPEPAFLLAGCDGELPLAVVPVRMAYPPNGGEMVEAVTSKGDIIGYRRVRVQQCKPTEAGDFWTDQDYDEIPGEYEFEIQIGDRLIRDMGDLAAELMKESPAQFTRLFLEMANVALDQSYPGSGPLAGRTAAQRWACAVLN